MTLHARRPDRADVLLAAIVTVITLAGSAALDAHLSGGATLSARTAHGSGSGRPLGVLGYLLIAATCAALAWRRSLPTPVLLWTFAGVSFLGLTGYRVGPEYLPLIVAFFAAVRYGDRRIAYAVLVAGFLLTFVRPLTQGRELISPAARLALAAWLLVLAAAAEITRIRGRASRAEAERSAQAEEARLEHARRRAGEERLRIAQDLHDVLAHQLALITVQANAGLALLRSHQPDRAGESLTAIKDAGNSALGELRSALETLRAPGGAPSRAPVPLLSRAADITQLADGARAAGLSVDVRVTGRQRPLLASTDRAAYRIVQEALTNAVRHAGPGPACRCSWTTAKPCWPSPSQTTAGAARRPRPPMAGTACPGCGSGPGPWAARWTAARSRAADSGWPPTLPLPGGGAARAPGEQHPAQRTSAEGT